MHADARDGHRSFMRAEDPDGRHGGSQGGDERPAPRRGSAARPQARSSQPPSSSRTRPSARARQPRRLARCDSRAADARAVTSSGSRFTTITDLIVVARDAPAPRAGKRSSTLTLQGDERGENSPSGGGPKTALTRDAVEPTGGLPSIPWSCAVAARSCSRRFSPARRCRCSRPAVGEGALRGLRASLPRRQPAPTRAIGADAYSQCMRSHGVPTFPDPDSRGVIEKGPGREPPGQSTHSGSTRRAMPAATCSRPGPAVQYRSAAPIRLTTSRLPPACAATGLLTFPTRRSRTDSVKFTIPSSINPNSPQVVHALPICRKLIPTGLPYSGTN